MIFGGEPRPWRTNSGYLSCDILSRDIMFDIALREMPASHRPRYRLGKAEAHSRLSTVGRYTRSHHREHESKANTIPARPASYKTVYRSQKHA